jgi:hypothetical protein
MKTGVNPWVSKLIEEGKILKELTGNIREIRTIVLDEICILCKGNKFLCGKAKCPILVRLCAQLKVKPLIDSLVLSGSSPGIFVGRFGYPYCFIGPLIPPFHGNTAFLNTPELWSNVSIDEIVSFRSQLVRGKYLVHVKNVTGEKIAEYVKEIALSKVPTDTEAEFTKKPSGRLILDDEVQPIGPSAPLKKLTIVNVKTDQRIEKAYNDKDLKAVDAVFQLYKKGVLISKIQTAFSAGLFGIGKNRRFVPTRWSITAVDSIISQKLLEEVKEFPLINEYRVYEHVALDNRWIVLMIPSFWSYEQMEAWYPRTIWNPSGKNVWIISDWEGFEGRSSYALTGGCYYSTRLAVCEHLVKERRQAAVITFREIHPGYIMPVGVWHTRESIRAAVKKQSMKFNDLKEALNYISTKLEIPLKDWVRNSSLLKSLLYQKNILNFLK